MSDKKVNKLLDKLTSFRTVTELRTAQDERGYVPTIYPDRGPESVALIQALRERGIRVWPD